VVLFSIDLGDFRITLMMNFQSLWAMSRCVAEMTTLEMLTGFPFVNDGDLRFGIGSQPPALPLLRMRVFAIKTMRKHDRRCMSSGVSSQAGEYEALISSPLFGVSAFAFFASTPARCHATDR
jgi:hypothetical protein